MVFGIIPPAGAIVRLLMHFLGSILNPPTQDSEALIFQKPIGAINARAERSQFAFLAVGIAGLASAASVPDKPVAEISPAITGE